MRSSSKSSRTSSSATSTSMRAIASVSAGSQGAGESRPADSRLGLTETEPAAAFRRRPSPAGRPSSVRFAPVTPRVKLQDMGTGQGRSRLDVSQHRIELRPAAVRALRKLDPSVRHRLQGAIALLAQDPRPPAARALQGRQGLRVRVGDYRILYTVADDVLLVVVVTIGHRRDVYDR